jgi:serine protease Do
MKIFPATALCGLLLLSIRPPASAQTATVNPPSLTAGPATAAPVLAAPQGKLAPPPGAVNIASEPIVRVVANVLPAVVNITADGTVPEYATYNTFFRQYRMMRNHPEESIGSGLIVSPDGYIITNAHVVALAEKEKSVTVTLSTGSKYQAQIVTADEDADLALLHIVGDKGVQFPYFDLSYVSPNLLGETVVALGSPAGYQNSVSHGILSASKRTFTVETHTYNNLLQTDAAINPGNSGGPLVDLNGGLVGINSAKLAGEAIENIGFAIPQEVVVPWANDAMAVARGLKTASTSSPTDSSLDAIHKHLGLQMETLTSDKADELNLDLDGGMLITKVEENSPAADAGLSDGMVVVAIGNRDTPDVKSLPKELQHLQPGVNVRLHLIMRQALGVLVIQRGGSVVLTAR